MLIPFPRRVELELCSSHGIKQKQVGVLVPTQFHPEIPQLGVFHQILESVSVQIIIS
jgi:hypothetical protein